MKHHLLVNPTEVFNRLICKIAPSRQGMCQTSLTRAVKLLHRSTKYEFWMICNTITEAKLKGQSYQPLTELIRHQKQSVPDKIEHQKWLLLAGTVSWLTLDKRG